MKRMANPLVTIVLALSLGTPLQANPQTDSQGDTDPSVESPTARLDGAEGRERYLILVDLARTADRDRRSDDAIEWSLEAWEMLPSVGDPESELILVNVLAAAHTRKNDLELAFKEAKRAETLAHELDDIEALAVALCTRGEIHGRRAEPDQALEAYDRAKEIYETLGDDYRVACLHNNSSVIYRGLGDSDEELALLLLAREAFEKAGSLDGMAVTALNIGNVHRSLGQLEGAEASYRNSLASAIKAGNELVRAGALRSLGLSALDQGNPQRALEILQEAGELYLVLGNYPTRLLSVYGTMGEAWEELGDEPRALEYHGKALAIATEIGNERMRLAAQAMIASIRGRQATPESTTEELEQAIEEARKKKFIPLMLSLLRNLQGTHAEAGRFREAYDVARRLEALSIESLSAEGRRNLTELQATFEAEERELRIELLEKDKDLQRAELDDQRSSRRALVAGFGLLLAALALLFNWYRLGTRAAAMTEAVEQERRISGGLRKIDQLKDEFLANTSHELRTPLYGMTGLVEAVLEDTSGIPQDSRESLVTVLASGRRLSNLINEILDYSKLRRDGLTLALEPVEIHSLADVVLALSKPLVADRNIELINTVDSALPPALADPARIEQILLNLVGHAIKFTSEGRVEISARQEGEAIKVLVKDSGPGIAPEHRESIFDYFVQADASVQREYGGVGLGLAVSRQLVELHGGHISVESSLGEGSTFSFTVPAFKADATESVYEIKPAPAVIRLAEPSMRGESLPDLLPESSPPGDPRTVLVVDDEPLVRQVLTQQLATAGYRLVAAKSGSEALELLESETVDLVLLDVMMPRMSGFEVCRAIRETRSREELPVIFLSAKNRQEDRVASFNEGGNDYLTKPIGREELLARVKVHIELLSVHDAQFEEIQALRGILPICSYCKKIRDDGGYWNQLEGYISQHTEAEFSHGICPGCMATNHPDL